MSEVELPKLDGLTFRLFRGESDYPCIVEIQNASEAADQIEETITIEEVANDFSHLENCDPFKDFIFAEANEEIVGFAKVLWRDTVEGARAYWQWGYLRPAWRRRGIGRAMLHYIEARARWHASANPFSGPAFLRSYCEDTALGKLALFEREGYQAIRYMFFMQHRDLSDLPDVPLPPGFEFRPARRDDMRAMWAAKEEAFLDHWGYKPKSEADYQHWLANPQNDLSLWRIVWDAEKNEVAGVSFNFINEEDNRRFGFRRGWVQSLGVRRIYRGRGLARALLVDSLKAMRERGMTEAVLGVDAENPTGALRLYESVGFRVLNKDAIYQKAL
jgi:ribosomal protein S18 acetylase RimI-like enzyme